MGNIFRSAALFRSVGHAAIGQSLQIPGVNADTFSDRGQQLQATEGVPTTALDVNKWNLPITSLAVTDAPWQPVYPDMIWKTATLALLMASTVVPVRVPDPPLTHPVYPERVPPARRVPWDQAYFAPDRQPEPPFECLVTYPDQIAAAARLPWYEPYFAPDRQPEPPFECWATYPDQIAAPVRVAWNQFIALPSRTTVYTGNQAVPIHVPDEVPPDVLLTISVEHDIGGGPVPYDVPPSLRVYHLDAAGAQVVDLAYGVCTQYGANPSYFRDWTPTATGKYMIEVLGVYLGLPVVGVQPITVRPKFDPIAIALQGDLVARNGDV